MWLKYSNAVVTLLLLALSQVTADECIKRDDEKAKNNPELRKFLYQGQLKFTLSLFDKVNKVQNNENIFFSPFSVYQSLLLAYISAGGDTEKSLKESLKIEDALDKQAVMSSYQIDKYAREHNEKSDSYEFTSANRLFADTGLAVEECAKQFFGEELEFKNLRTNPAQSRVEINDWVAKITKNHIKDLLPEDALGENSQLVLANAAYFKGNWVHKFPEENTKKDAFYVSPDRQTKVPFMKQKGMFNYMLNTELGAQILELPYKGNEISLYILLPPYIMENGVSNIIKNLTPERLAEAFVDNKFMYREVIVEIPKFTMEKSLPLRDVLEDMGVGDMFNYTSDFSTLTKQKVLFDDAVHKAKIDINEEGTVAAAASAVFGFRSARPLEPTRFVANFPFVYIIYERPTQSVLFMGVYRDPKK